MHRTPIMQLDATFDNRVLIYGWVNTIRDQRYVQFLIIRDETGMVQVVHEKRDDELTRLVSSLTAETAVRIVGTLVSNKKVQLRQMEVVLEELEVLSKAETPIPIDSNTQLDQRLDWRFLDLRRAENHLIFQVQTTAEYSMRKWWVNRGFIEIHSPKLMGVPSESGAELFKVEYFGRDAYLAQSPQFYKQMAIASGFGNVFEIGPVFRANPSFTSRHDTEFTSVDVELSWIDSHYDVMKFEEDWLQAVIREVSSTHGDSIRDLFKVDVHVPQVPFPRITLADALDVLEGLGHALPRDGSSDLDPAGERLLSKYVRDQYDHEFVFVTDYPSQVRPFYHMRHSDDPTQTKSFDLLWNGIEVTTGAQREHRHDVLSLQALEKGLKLELIQFYLDCFKYGCPPHGGFGFGLTRMLMVMLGLKNVREVTYLYRGPNRLAP